MAAPLAEHRWKVAASLGYAARRLWRRSDLEEADLVVLDLVCEALSRLGHLLRPKEGQAAVEVLASAPRHYQEVASKLLSLAKTPSSGCHEEMKLQGNRTKVATRIQAWVRGVWVRRRLLQDRLLRVPQALDHPVEKGDDGDHVWASFYSEPNQLAGGYVDMWPGTDATPGPSAAAAFGLDYMPFVPGNMEHRVVARDDEKEPKMDEEHASLGENASLTVAGFRPWRWPRPVSARWHWNEDDVQEFMFVSKAEKWDWDDRASATTGHIVRSPDGGLARIED